MSDLFDGAVSLGWALVYAVPWLGGTAIGYAIGALVALALALIEVQWAPIRSAGLPAMWTIAVVSLAVTVVGYRPAKAIWFALVYEMGFMDPDNGASRQ